MSWPTIPFEDLYDVPSRNGVTRPSKVRGSGFKMINMGELFGHDRIDEIDMERVQLNDREVARFLVEPGDLLFARQSLVLSGAGKCSIVSAASEPTTFESHLIRVRLKSGLADPRFFHYFFKSPASGMRSIVTQGVQAGIRANDLKRLLVPVPELQEQKRIADTLAVYDDLIENNRRRIKLLEESARLLYREWFVHLCFPGHEHVKIVDGVPDGWEQLRVSDLCVVGRGGSPRPIAKFMGGTIPWFKIGDATASEGIFVFETEEMVSEDGAKKSVYLQPEELILSNSATCGVPYFTGVAGCIHDGWLYFKDLCRVSKWFLFCCLHSKQKEILSGIGEGATQKNLNTEYVGGQKLLLPADSEVLRGFDESVIPQFKQISVLAQHNRKLRQARDLLLPRLMSGDLRIA